MQAMGKETRDNTGVNMLTQELDNLTISKIVKVGGGGKAKNDEEDIKERKWKIKWKKKRWMQGKKR